LEGGQNKFLAGQLPPQAPWLRLCCTKSARDSRTNIKLTPTQDNYFKHKYLHATCGITTEEGIELWSLCIKDRCLTAQLPASA